MLVAQLYPILCDPMDCSPPVSSVQGILQARILEWIAIPFSRGSSQPMDQTLVSCIAGKLFTIWATGKTSRRHLALLNSIFPSEKKKSLQCPHSVALRTEFMRLLSFLKSPSYSKHLGSISFREILCSGMRELDCIRESAVKFSGVRGASWYQVGNLKLTTTGIFTPQKLTNATTGFQYPLVILFQDHYLSMIQCSWPEMEGEACRELRTVMQSQQQVVMGTEQILRKTVSHHLLFPLPNIQKRYIISNYTKIFPSLETQAWKIK